MEMFISRGVEGKDQSMSGHQETGVANQIPAVAMVTPAASTHFPLVGHRNMVTNLGTWRSALPPWPLHTAAATTTENGEL